MRSRFYLLRRIQVPQEMSVTGADNVKLWEFCYPALTTVHIPRERIGHIICEMLLRRSTPARPRGGDGD